MICARWCFGTYHLIAHIESVLLPRHLFVYAYVNGVLVSDGNHGFINRCVVLSRTPVLEHAAYRVTGFCHTATTLIPNSTILASIEACQAAANTTSCYPPNGTRICVPSDDITCIVPLSNPTRLDRLPPPVYWPPGFYHSDSIISLEYDLDSSFTFFKNNTGNRTDYFTEFMYTSQAEPIPDVVGEKRMQMYYLERRTDDQFPLLNYETHYGPELVLVKTAEFTTTASASATATATGRAGHDSDDDSDDDDPSRLSNRNIAIIAVCVTLGVLGALLFLCVRRCTGKGKRSKNEAEITQTLQAVDRELGRMQPREPGHIFSLGAIHDSTTGPGTAISNRAEYRAAQRQNADEVAPILPPYTQDEPPKYTP